MAATLKDGQLSAVQTVLWGRADPRGADLRNADLRVSIILTNVGEAEETVVLALARPDRPARQVRRAVLAPCEQLELNGLVVDFSDTLYAQASNDFAVDFLMQRCADATPYGSQIYDADGSPKQGGQAPARYEGRSGASGQVFTTLMEASAAMPHKDQADYLRPTATEGLPTPTTAPPLTALPGPPPVLRETLMPAPEFDATRTVTARQQTVTATGKTQHDAAALIEGANHVTGCNNHRGVVLPTAVVGLEVTVHNTSENKSLKVYPASGARVTDFAADEPLLLAGGLTLTLRANSEGRWE